MTNRAPSRCGPTLFIRRAGAVLGADRTRVSLDDLARDRQAEAGILAEPLFGPVGVEALENPIECIGLDAWSGILHQDLDFVLAPSQRMRTGSSGGEKERALSIRLLKTCPRRLSWPMAR